MSTREPYVRDGMQGKERVQKRESGSARETNGQKGQIFSIDFVLAIAVLSLSLGIALQTIDLAQKNEDVYAQLQSNQAELIAENWTHPSQGFSGVGPYCLSFSNGSGDCSVFQCADNTFTAQRLIECQNADGPSICRLEVRTCA